MAKMTLLEMTQDIANDLESDEISTITATTESVLIAQIIKTVFFELIATRNWPHLKGTFQLEAPSFPATTPTHLKVPDLTKELITINYNKRKVGDTKDKYDEVTWLEPEEFLRRTNSRDSSQSNIDTVTELGGISIYIRNDKQPEFYTSFDDEYVVFDSYDSGVDATNLDITKTQVLGYTEPTWTHSDSFIPDLPSEAFPGFLSEAKSKAYISIKQEPNLKEETISKKNQRTMSRKSWKINGGVRYPNYGRKGRVRSMQKSTLIEKDN